MAVWDLEEMEEPIEEVGDAHGDMINCVDGDRESGVVVTGARDGEVRVWDRRDLRQCVVNMAPRAGDTRHDTWTVTTRDNVICAGYSNGDIKMFDIRASAVTWESNFGGGKFDQDLENSFA